MEGKERLLRLWAGLGRDSFTGRPTSTSPRKRRAAGSAHRAEKRKKNNGPVQKDSQAATVGKLLLFLFIYLSPKIFQIHSNPK
jgi:hypothetical protein